MDTGLSRFWFPVAGHFGIGVTAFTLDEATRLATEVSERYSWGRLGTPVKDIDIRGLDQTHVIPNMGPSSVRGVWYPFLNL
jgi:hypothetical protein